MMHAAIAHHRDMQLQMKGLVASLNGPAWGQMLDFLQLIQLLTIPIISVDITMLYFYHAIILSYPVEYACKGGKL